MEKPSSVEADATPGGPHSCWVYHISNIGTQQLPEDSAEIFNGRPNKMGTSYALDCGAATERITKLLLLLLFRVVDMIDMMEGFLAKAKIYMGEEGKKMRNYFWGCRISAASLAPMT